MKSIGVLFDLDGVLIDSESEYTKVWSEVNRRFPSQYSHGYSKGTGDKQRQQKNGTPP